MNVHLAQLRAAIDVVDFAEQIRVEVEIPVKQKGQKGGKEVRRGSIERFLVL